MKKEKHIRKSKKKILRLMNLILLMVLFALLISLSGCGDYFDALENIAQSPSLPSKTPVVSPSPSPKPSETPKEKPSASPSPSLPVEEEIDQSLVYARNPLIGRYEYMHEFSTKTRPLAIIQENTWQSLPQHGLQSADIVIEMLVEYEISRFLAIYQDPYNVEKIGAVRSLRSYFTQMALAFDGYIVHYGYSDSGRENAKGDLARRGLTTINGLFLGDGGNPFWRDRSRLSAGYSSEHTVVTAGDNLLNKVSSLPESVTKKENRDYVFSFSNTSSAEGKSPANDIYIGNIYVNSPYFLYNQELEKYERYQFGQAHYEGNTGEILNFDNVFVLKMDTWPLNDSLRHVAMTTYGWGSGYYFNKGAYVPIQWKRNNDSSHFEIFYEGEILKVARGNTWICCIPSNRGITIR